MTNPTHALRTRIQRILHTPYCSTHPSAQLEFLYHDLMLLQEHIVRVLDHEHATSPRPCPYFTPMARGVLSIEATIPTYHPEHDAQTFTHLCAYLDTLASPTA